MHFNILIERYSQESLKEARAFIIHSRGGEVNNSKQNYVISEQALQQGYNSSPQTYPPYPPPQIYPLPSPTLSFPAEPPITSNTEYVNIESDETTSQKKKKKKE
jgi:hypothetical protein